MQLGVSQKSTAGLRLRQWCGCGVTQPDDTPADRAMAATLQQERFLLRVAVHVFEGRMCFYK
jgi:hypothetical protein